jgi:predicted amidohydrolase
MRRKILALFALMGMTFLLVACGNSEDIARPMSVLNLAPMGYDDSGAPTRLEVASVCLRPDTEAAPNRAKIINFVDAITQDHPGVRLIVFGETSLGYYYRPADPVSYQRGVAETIPGTTTNALAAEALAHNVYISMGLTESAGTALYNSQVLIDPAGQIVSVHRKVHLTSWDIESGFTAGTDVTFSEIDGVKVATVICYDMQSESVMRSVVAGGAKLVILSLADMDDESFIHYSCESFTSAAWVVIANRVGTEDGNSYAGHVSINAPSGEIRVKSAGAEGYVCAEVGIW